jgi:hypothetical protein
VGGWWGVGSGPHAGMGFRFLDAHLLKGALAGDSRVRDLAEDAEHCEAAVVQLAGLEAQPLRVVLVGHACAVKDTNFVWKYDKKTVFGTGFYMGMGFRHLPDAVEVSGDVALALGGGCESVLEEADEGDDLHEAEGGDLAERLEGVARELAVKKGVELLLRQPAQHGEHGYAAVLELGVSVLGNGGSVGLGETYVIGDNRVSGIMGARTLCLHNKHAQ